MSEWFRNYRPQRADNTEETIYKLIPDEPIVLKKPPLYRSIHSGVTPPTASSFNTSANLFSSGVFNLGGSIAVEPRERSPYHSHKIKRHMATMGYPRVPRSAPADFMRKGAGHAAGDNGIGAFSYGDEATRKPTVTRREEAPVYGLTTSKNFITSNAIENILAEPARPRASRGEEVMRRQHSFGQVPGYLRRMKTSQLQMLDSMKQQELQRLQVEQERVKLLGAPDRAIILRQLKAKWDHVNEQYQKGSTLDLKKLDTMGKVRRKENYEATLQTLEGYIDRLTAKRHVFIAA